MSKVMILPKETNMHDGDIENGNNSVDDTPAFSLSSDENLVLKRYHSAYLGLLESGAVQNPNKEYTEKDIGAGIIQFSLLDMCVAHGLQGAKYVDEIAKNCNHLILQSALILTITTRMFMSPPAEFGDDDSFRKKFSAIVGVAAFLQIFVLLCCTVESLTLARPYDEIDTLIARFKTQNIIVLMSIVNYLGLGLFATSMYMAAFNRSGFDGGVQLIFIPFLLFLAFTFASSTKMCDNFQDARCIKFYKKYCEKDASLKAKYLEQIKSK